MKRGYYSSRSTNAWLLALLVGCLMVLPGQAWALTPCGALSADICADPSIAAQDCDGDGFFNGQECNGLDPAASDQYIFIDGYNDGVPRADRLDPSQADVFIITVPDSPSVLFTDLYAHVSNVSGGGSDTGGLGITVHELDANDVGVDQYGDPDRRMTNYQKALLVYEHSFSPYVDAAACQLQPGWTEDDLIFGEAYYGTANEVGNLPINLWPQMIMDFLTCKYSGASNAMPADLPREYIMEVAAHEVGHHMMLTKDYTARFNGYHVKTGEGVIMEQSVKYSIKKGVTTFYLSSDFSDMSRTDAKLR